MLRQRDSPVECKRVQLPPNQRWSLPEEMTLSKQGRKKNERRSDFPKPVQWGQKQVLPLTGWAKLLSFLHKDLNKCDFKAKQSIGGASYEWSSSRRLAAAAKETDRQSSHTAPPKTSPRRLLAWGTSSWENTSSRPQQGRSPPGELVRDAQHGSKVEAWASRDPVPLSGDWEAPYPAPRGRLCLSWEGDFHPPTMTEVMPQDLLEELTNMALRPGLGLGQMLQMDLSHPLSCLLHLD